MGDLYRVLTGSYHRRIPGKRPESFSVGDEFRPSQTELRLLGDMLELVERDEPTTPTEDKKGEAPASPVPGQEDGIPEDILGEGGEVPAEKPEHPEEPEEFEPEQPDQVFDLEFELEKELESCAQGGGFYQLPTGQRVKGKARALDQLRKFLEEKHRGE